MCSLNPLHLSSVTNIKSFLYKIYWRIDKEILSWISQKRRFITNDDTTKITYPKIKNQKTIFTSTVWESEIIDKKLIVDKDTLELIWIGRISIEKGLETLLHAILKLDHFMKIKATIIGDGPKDYISHLKRIVSPKSGIVKFNNFVSNRSELYSILDKHDVFINPSMQDAQPRTIWEAMARALPIICSDTTSAIYKEFKNNDKIKFFKAGVVDDLCNQIKSANSAKVRKKMSSESLKIVRKKTLEISAKYFSNSLD